MFRGFAYSNNLSSICWSFSNILPVPRVYLSNLIFQNQATKSSEFLILKWIFWNCILGPNPTSHPFILLRVSFQVSNGCDDKKVTCLSTPFIKWQLKQQNAINCSQSCHFSSSNSSCCSTWEDWPNPSGHGAGGRMEDLWCGGRGGRIERVVVQASYDVVIEGTILVRQTKVAMNLSMC